MDFFQRQELARRQTRWLQVYFLLAVAGTIASLYVAALLLVRFETAYPSRHHYYRAYSSYQEPPPFRWWDPAVFGCVAAATLAVIVGGGLYKASQLSGGGAAVAASLGGRPVAPNTADADERKFLNVVEEMAIASGTPLPKAYVLPGVRRVNAFAAGHGPRDAVVCVTEGALRQLGRDELQGVVGHEFSHILNGDMRLNLRLMGTIFGILCLTLIGKALMQARGRNAGGAIMAGALLLLIGSVGAFFARLIKCAVNRQREFLADASAVQFTRNPAGLADALKKGARYGSTIDGSNAEDASHLFFLDGMPGSPFSLFSMSTHPPVKERIRELDPAWDGQFTSLTKPSAAPAAPEVTLWPKPAPPLPAVPIAIAAGLAARVGTVTPAHLDYAAALRSSLPESLVAAAREPLPAAALVYALLLAPGEAARAPQLAMIGDEAARAGAARLFPAVQALDSRARLPLLTLCLGALRTLSAAQYAEFSRTLPALAMSDGQVDLFEYVAQRMIRAQLDPHFVPAPPKAVQYYDLAPLLPECALLLSALAYAGQGEDDFVGLRAAFAAGASGLAPDPAALRLLDRSAYDLSRVDAVLDRLNLASPAIKRKVLDACAATVAADGEIQEGEAELLRAVADALDCPVPPFLA